MQEYLAQHAYTSATVKSYFDPTFFEGSSWIFAYSEAGKVKQGWKYLMF